MPSLELFDRWNDTLSTFGLRASTGPLVPFRAKTWLHKSPGDPRAIPLLWGNHVHPMRIQWPLPSSRTQALAACVPERLTVAAGTRVLLRRTSPKEQSRRAIAAPLFARRFPGHTRIGLENHVNHVHCPGAILQDDVACGLAAFYNSSLCNDYLGIVLGTTQLNAVDLMSMPLPSPAILSALGRRVANVETPCFAMLDEAVAGSCGATS